MTIDGIRQNMQAESGMTQQAIEERSSLPQMKNLTCPVLILHGEKDQNVPVNQATMLRDELLGLNKEFDLHLYPEAAHSIGAQEVQERTIDFFNRKLKTAT